MDIIRSNYSTIGPYAQQEAPSAPEYPYTDILDAYRGAMEAADRLDEGEEVYVDNWQPLDGSQNHTSQNKGFQRLLTHLFGDYFKEDADEEIASDMADRWVAFSRTGDPNYDESKAEWRPWRFNFEGGRDRDTSPWRPEELDFLDIENDRGMEDDDNRTAEDGYVWSEDPLERAYRKRALKAIGMEVIEEDVFQTMLRRIPKGNVDTSKDYPFNGFLFGGSNKPAKDQASHDRQLTRRAVRQLQQIAQDMGVLGRGLQGETPRRGNAMEWEDDFFPEMLELKWPPDGRLVERDCTCDLWDNIRCKSILYALHLLSFFLAGTVCLPTIQTSLFFASFFLVYRSLLII
jgi:hypothetical protein